MPRETLLDFFQDLAAARGDFLLHDDGYRARRYSYATVAAAARTFACRLQQAGLAKGDAVLVWSENRPEWIAAFWGCLLAGVVVVPIDYRSSLDFVNRVRALVNARLLLVGDDMEAARSADFSQALAGTDAWRLSAFDWHGRFEPAPVAHTRDDVAEIIFTSGATSEPKGVVITHRNILANIVPVENEVRKYRAWGRPFFPLRFLNLLPLSHLFGQAMATFIPPMLPGIVVFMRGYSPSEVVRQVRQRRISVVVCVPKMLDVLREFVVRTVKGTDEPPDQAAAGARLHVARRWWRYRAAHRAFGLKFWSFVVGAAPLEPSLEAFWSRLGFLVIQGYGLTETAPIVSLNHPFAATKGSVGKAIAGIEVRIAADGEILVRGENVTRGYYGDAGETAGALEDGWLHTGDVGELDEEGQLFVRGRKKEMIVTPDGLNVFPEDVERVLNGVPGVRESAVVGAREGGEERVHAVLVLDAGREAAGVVREANTRLAEHQRIRGVSVWPWRELPRTEGTEKLKRRVVREWVEGRRGTAGPPTARAAAGSTERSVQAILARFAGDRPLRPEMTLEELGLSSLDRVELMVALEDRLGTTVEESGIAGAKTIGEVEAMLASPLPGAPSASGAAEWSMPAWNRRLPARWFRVANLTAWILPLARLFARLRVEGLEHLPGLDQPVIFAANHQSHMDTPAILAALPAAWRHRVAVAMAKEYFGAHFHPESHGRAETAVSTGLYLAAALFFNAFPLPQREAGTRRTLRYIGELLNEGWSVLIYPEGERTEAGEIRGFRPGIGMVGARLAVPVVPVRLEGLEKVLHRSWRMIHSGPVRVAFGAALTLEGDDYARLAEQVEKAVRAL